MLAGWMDGDNLAVYVPNTPPEGGIALGPHAGKPDWRTDWRTTPNNQPGNY